MKKTEIGVIPDDWEVKSIMEFSEVKTGPFGSALHEKDYVIEGTPIVTVEHLGEFGLTYDNLPMVSENDLKRLSSYSLKAGDIVFSRVGSVDRNAIIRNQEDGWLFSGRLLRVRIKETSVNAKFLSFYFHFDSFKSRVRNLAVGQTMASLNTQILNSLKVIHPPLHEQRAIAKALSDTDSWIESLEKLIAKKQLIKKGAMQRLLTPKEGWEKKHLGEVAKVTGGGTPSTFVASYWNGTINWFTPTEVGMKKYLRDSQRKITKEGLINSSATILPAGTILLTTRAGIGDLGILTEPAATNQGFQSLIVNNDHFNEFIYYLLSTKKNLLLQNASGSTFLEISPSKVKAIELNVPCFREQKRVALILSDIDSEIAALQNKLDKVRQLKQGMMQQLLTGKIRLQVESVSL